MRFFRIFAHKLRFGSPVSLPRFSERNVFKSVAHTVIGDHFADRVGCPLDIVCGSGRNLVEDDLFGSTSAEEDIDFVDQIAFRLHRFFFLFTVLRKASDTVRARNDGDLVDRRIVGRKSADERVPRFVERDDAPFFFVFLARLFFETDAHFVDRVVKIGHRHFRVSVAYGEQCRFVYDVRKVGPRKTYRTVGEGFEIDVGIELDVFRVDAQNLFPALDVGTFDGHLAVKAAGAQKRGIEYVGAVRRRQNDQSFFVVETVHFDEELVERLFAFVVAAEVVHTAFADRVEFVDKDDARRFFARLAEEIANAARTDADEHFNEVRTRNAEKRYARFSRYGAREERFTRTRRPDQEHALRDLTADVGVFFRLL